MTPRYLWASPRQTQTQPAHATRLQFHCPSKILFSKMIPKMTLKAPPSTKVMREVMRDLCATQVLVHFWRHLFS